MKLNLEALESRDCPSATLLNGTLFVLEQGSGTHTVSVDNVNNQIQVTEGDGSGFNNAVSLFDPTTVTGLVVFGAEHAPNVIQQNTALPCLLLGGFRADTIFGGSGMNVISPGGGDDTVYSLLGTNTIDTLEGGRDRVFTNYNALVFSNDSDLVVRFFGPGRMPGTPFIGLDPTLNDSVLYITPSNNGSWTLLEPGRGPGEIIAFYDLGDGAGPQTQVFEGVRAVAYFGGSGNDTFLDNTSMPGAAYGSAGNDVLVSGTGAFFLLKGSGGNDVLLGRARSNDLSGNAGSDILVDLGTHRDDVIRTDFVPSADMVFALAPYISISP